MTFERKGKDRYRPTLAIVRVGGQNVGKTLIREDLTYVQGGSGTGSSSAGRPRIVQHRLWDNPFCSVMRQQLRQSVDVHHHRLTLMVQRRSVASLTLEPDDFLAATGKGSDQRFIVVGDRRCFKGCT